MECLSSASWRHEPYWCSCWRTASNALSSTYTTTVSCPFNSFLFIALLSHSWEWNLRSAPWQCPAWSPCLKIENRHRGQESTSPDNAQEIAAWCLVASSVLQHGTKDRDMIYDCSVHRSTGFRPKPHQGSKLLCKRGLLEELGWERASEPVALGSVLG